ncbi:DEAD/DEAH box helicase [Bacillus cereus]
MAFKKRTKTNSTVTSPISLFRDLKNRKIMGLLDHQTEMIEKYMVESVFKLQDIAIELPTGSGKTLVGLLIAEYRRRVKKEKVVYLCPTKQLVNQVVEDSERKYGIKTSAFIGKQADYSPEMKSQYRRGETIAVTTYSGLFNTNTFFNDADIIIFDDAHTAENYIASLWSLTINRFDNEGLYHQIIELLRPVLTHSNYETMKAQDPFSQEKGVVEKLPTTHFYEYLNKLIPLIDASVKGTNLRYPWGMIRNNLHACHLYMSWNEILIRPLIPPTLSHDAFNNAKQRIYMSATLGLNGDLERMIGVPKIHRLPAPDGWDKQGLGRRLFIFPEATMNEEQAINLTMKMISQVDRSLVLVPDEKNGTKLEESIKNQTGYQIINAKEMEKSKDTFTKETGVVSILANRFEGIDLADEDCRLLILKGIPRATHLQEKFIMSRMSAAVLFNDRIRTRLVQALGRCTRHPVDYAAVCILGQELIDELVPLKKLELFHPELQAEIIFGYDQSRNIESENELLENLGIFLEHKDDWNEADEDILEERDERVQINLPAAEKLLEAAEFEVQFLYALWNQNFDYAMENIGKVIGCISGDDVKGYRSFWYYIAGSTAWIASKYGINTYSPKVYEYYNQAAACTRAIPWLNRLASLKGKEQQVEQQDPFIPVLIENLEINLEKLGITSDRKFEQKVIEILGHITSKDGNKFEIGHEMLGEFLGYKSSNSEESSAPDPWWIVDNNICIVAEDKIYESEEKRIPAKDVKQAVGHPVWLKENTNDLNADAQIHPIMITTANYIEKGAAVFAQNVLYWNREEFVNWAYQAIGTIRTLRQRYSGMGDTTWRAEAIEYYKNNKIGPLQILEQLNGKLLKELPN